MWRLGGAGVTYSGVAGHGSSVSRKQLRPVCGGWPSLPTLGNSELSTINWRPPRCCVQPLTATLMTDGVGEDSDLQYRILHITSYRFKAS